MKKVLFKNLCQTKENLNNLIKTSRIRNHRYKKIEQLLIDRLKESLKQISIDRNNLQESIMGPLTDCFRQLLVHKLIPN